MGNPGGVFGVEVLDVLDLSDPANTAGFLTRFTLPAAPGGVLEGVTSAADLDLRSQWGAYVTARNGLTLDNSILYLGDPFGEMYGQVYFEGTQTLGGSGTVLLGSYASNGIYAAGSGDRRFDVRLNGTPVLMNFDISAEADGEHQAVVREFTATADANGQILALFSATDSSALVSGIEVYDGGNRVLAIDSGNEPSGTIHIRPGSFENQGVLEARHSGTLVLSNFGDSIGTIIAGVGGRVVVEGDFSQSATASLTIEIAGTATDQFGHLEVNGAATFDGDLQVVVSSDYSSDLGDTFELISYFSQAGTFASISGLDLGNGTMLEPTYDAAGLTLTVVAGSPLMAADGFGPITWSDPLTGDDAAQMLSAAIRRWELAGLDQARLASLNALTVHVADLHGTHLALSTGNTILIDRYAAGYGWFIDLTPHADEEFLGQVNGGLLSADEASTAFGRMDLLTVLVHELGHVLGLEHSHDPDDLLYESLAAGQRKGVLERHVDAAFPAWAANSANTTP